MAKGSGSSGRSGRGRSGGSGGGGSDGGSGGGGVSGDSLAIAPLSEFAKQVQGAANSSEDRTFSGKSYISEAWQNLRARGSTISLEQFKERVVQAGNRGLLRTSRNDLSYAAPNQRAVSDSRTVLPGGGVVHFIGTN